MDKSSRYTFDHVAEFTMRFRDLHVVAKHTESDRSILWRLSIESAARSQLRDSCKRCNTCRTRKPFIAVLWFRARKSRFVTSMIVPGIVRHPTPSLPSLIPGIISIAVWIMRRALRWKHGYGRRFKRS